MDRRYPGEIPVQTLMEYFELWDMLENIILEEGIPDRHIWRLCFR
jgi:hypothetical protein